MNLRTRHYTVSYTGHNGIKLEITNSNKDIKVETTVGILSFDVGRPSHIRAGDPGPISIKTGLRISWYSFLCFLIVDAMCFAGSRSSCLD